jgi:uncharacterized protein (TIGR03437 family)
MKFIVLIALFAAQLFAAPGAASKKFFRDPKAAVKPKQAGDTVVVNAASFLVGVSPGALATVFGTNLTDVNGEISAVGNPLPLVLANVAVDVNGVPAPMFSVAYEDGQDVINFQVPWETPTGPGAAEVQVYDYGQLVADVVVDSFTEDPGIFGYQEYGNTYAVALHDDFTLIGPNNPASPGEIIVLYANGLGPVNQPVADGFAAPSFPLADTEDAFAVTIGGETAAIYFAGLAPEFVGVYQINLALPPDLPAGDLTIRIDSAFANSQTVLLSVQ